MPEGWITTTVSGLVDVIRGVTYQKSDARDLPEERFLPILRANNIQNGRLVLDGLVYVPEACVSEKQLIQPGDIIVAMSSGSKSVVGKAAMSATRWNGAFGAFCGVLRPLAGLDYRYISWFTHSGDYRRAVSELSAGVNINNLKPAHFEEIALPLAPLAEQKVIADKLDALLAQVDTLKARLDAIPAILKRFRQSVLSAAVTGKLTPQSTQLCSINLGELADLVNGDRGENYPNRSEYVPFGLPFINTGHIESDGSLNLDSMNYITREKFDTLRGGKIQPGDLVYCLRGATLGKTAFVAPFKEGAIASSLVIIRPGPRLLVKYAYLFLVSPLGRDHIEIFDNGSAQPNLSANSVKQYLVPLPSITEQTEIVHRVDLLFAFADQIEARAQEAIARVKHLTQSILAKAFRGELTEEWRKAHPELVSGENSAVALLERIRAARAATPDAKGKRGRKAQHSPSEATAPAITSWRGDSVAKLVGEDFSPSPSTPKKRGRPRKG